MRSLEYTAITDPTTAQMAAFKGYIGQSGTAADEYLAVLLRDAFIKVGEWADVSLLVATVKLSVSDFHGGIRLYGTPNTITSVKDSAGNDIEYTYHSVGKSIELNEPAEECVVIYTTQVVTSSLLHLPKAWDYAKARFDGEGPEKLGEILSRA